VNCASDDREVIAWNFEEPAAKWHLPMLLVLDETQLLEERPNRCFFDCEELDLAPRELLSIPWGDHGSPG
jgi:hypothetical protein